MKPLKVDILLLIPALLLLGCSISTQMFLDHLGGHYGRMQAIWSGLGIALFYLVARGLDDDSLKKFAVPFYAVALMALGLVLIAGTGQGAKRWFHLGPISVQPSEFGKPALAMMLAWIVSRMSRKARLTEIWLAITVVGAIPTIFVFMEPDLGTALVYFATTVAAMISLPMVRWKHILGLVAFLLLVGTAAFWSLQDYQRQRIVEFIEGKRGFSTGGYQVAQALVVFGSGGITGTGFSEESLQVMRYLPARRTDFIMATIGHIIGFIGSVGIMSLLFWLPARMLWVRSNLAEGFGSRLLLHLAMYLMAQITINLGVALNLLPVTGIPLPLLSYGGSGVLSTMLTLGLASPYAREAAEVIRRRKEERKADMVRPRV